MNAWLKSPSSRIALGALVIAAIVFAWTLVSAFRSDSLPPAQTQTIASLESIRHRMSKPSTDIQSVVDNDLFSPDRESPGGSYRMPGEPDPQDKPAEPTKPLVLGTAVASDGRHFATLQLGGSHPTLVHVGDKFGDWFVRAIARGKVTLVTSAGSRVDLTVDNNPSTPRRFGDQSTVFPPNTTMDFGADARAEQRAEAAALRAQAQEIRANARVRRDTMPNSWK